MEPISTVGYMWKFSSEVLTLLGHKTVCGKERTSMGTWRLSYSHDDAAYSLETHVDTKILQIRKWPCICTLVHNCILGTVERPTPALTISDSLTSEIGSMAQSDKQIEVDQLDRLIKCSDKTTAGTLARLACLARLVQHRRSNCACAEIEHDEVPVK